MSPGMGRSTEAGNKPAGLRAGKVPRGLCRGKCGQPRGATWEAHRILPRAGGHWALPRFWSELAAMRPCWVWALLFLGRLHGRFL